MEPLEHPSHSLCDKDRHQRQLFIHPPTINYSNPFNVLSSSETIKSTPSSTLSSSSSTTKQSSYFRFKRSQSTDIYKTCCSIFFRFFCIYINEKMSSTKVQRLKSSSCLRLISRNNTQQSDVVTELTDTEQTLDTR